MIQRIFFASKGKGFVLFFILLNWFLLSSCGDEPLPGDKAQYIQDAVNAVNGGTPLPIPTLDPNRVLDLKLVLVGGPLYYTRQVSPAPQVQLFVINAGLSTVYISSCEGTILQRKESDVWINIASARHCGSQPNKIPMTANGQFNLSFEFLKAALYPGQSFYIPGTYRLVVSYSLICPPARNDYAACIDRYWQPSTEFQLKPLPDDSPVPG